MPGSNIIKAVTYNQCYMDAVFSEKFPLFAAVRYDEYESAIACE
jgi:hypothetical protein